MPSSLYSHTCSIVGGDQVGKSHAIFSVFSHTCSILERGEIRLAQVMPSSLYSHTCSIVGGNQVGTSHVIFSVHSHTCSILGGDGMLFHPYESHMDLFWGFLFIFRRIWECGGLSDFFFIPSVFCYGFVQYISALQNSFY